MPIPDAGDDRNESGASQPPVNAQDGSQDQPDLDAQSLTAQDDTGQATAEETASGPTEEEEDAEHEARGNVPYDRFKTVNEERKAAKAEREAARTEAARFKEAWDILAADPSLESRLNPQESPAENVRRIARENQANAARQNIVSTRERERIDWQGKWDVTFEAAEDAIANPEAEPEEREAAKAHLRALREQYKRDLTYFVRPQDTAIAAEVQQQTAVQQSTAARAKILADFPDADPELVDDALATGNVPAARKIAERAHASVQRAKEAATAARDEALRARAATPNPPTASNGRPPTPRTKSVNDMSEAEFTVWLDRQTAASKARKYGN